MNPAVVGNWNRESVVAAMDLPPSILQLARVRPDKTARFDGEPLAETLLGYSTKGRREPIYFRRPPDRDNAFGMRDAPDLAMRSGRWKLLCEYDGSDAELYNIVADPGETRNLAVENAPVVMDLTNQLLAWHQSMPADNGETYVERRPRNQNLRGQPRNSKRQATAPANGN
jgi:arylsulfatase A-like enzyme